jgi:YtkA-like
MLSTKSWQPTALVLLVSAFLFGLVSTSSASAAETSRDYRFDVLNQPVTVGAHSELIVELTRVSSAQPVDDAKVTIRRLEMTHMHPPQKSSPPGGMTTTMSGDVKFLGSPGPGQYRFMADVSMPGKWELDISADVPGEAEPIVDTVKFEAGR